MIIITRMQRNASLVPEPAAVDRSDLKSGAILTMVGWAQYFSLGHVGPACAAVRRHAVRRLRQWLGRKHRTKAGNFVRIPAARLQHDCGLIRLTRPTPAGESFRARTGRSLTRMRRRSEGDAQSDVHQVVLTRPVSETYRVTDKSAGSLAKAHRNTGIRAHPTARVA